jgi:predicted O-methyltransferase YrrM
MNPFGEFEYRSDFDWSERNFPTQESLRYLYSSRETVSYEVALAQFMGRIARLDDPRSLFDLEEPPDWTVEQMASSPLQTAFFGFIANCINARRVLEIGTFVGLGAMQFARSLSAAGSVTTIEKYSKFAEIARRNIVRNGMSERVEVLTGELSSLMDSGEVSGEFDVILIDGGKEDYARHLECSLLLLSSYGVIIIDNVFFLGDVLNETPVTLKGKGVRECLELVSGRSDLNIVFVPFSDGMLLVQRCGV